jgi:CTD kinase subunit gamma
LACFLPLTESAAGERALAIDIEFENEWETTSDWNEDDDDAATEEAELCFRAEGEGPMDLS